MKWYTVIIIIVIGYMCYNVGRHTVKPQYIKGDTIKVCDTIRSVSDTTIYRDVPYETTIVKWDTITRGTVLPIVTKIYKDTLFNKCDTLYMESCITGTNVRRDSLRVDWRKSDVVSKEYIYIREKEKNRRIHIGPMVGIGYGIANRKMDMYVGVGISYDLW